MDDNSEGISRRVCLMWTLGIGSPVGDADALRCQRPFGLLVFGPAALLHLLPGG